MSTCLFAVVALLLPFADDPVADDPVFSGPQTGENLTRFVMTGVLGNAADRKIDPVAEADGKPIVLVFVHERSRPAFGLANVVMRLVANRGAEKIIGGLVFLTDDPTETANWMNRISRYFPHGVNIGISPDGKEGPGAYGLNRNVALTVLVAKESRVTACFALVQPSLEVDAPKIFKAIAEVLGEEDVPRVSDYSRQSAKRMAATKDGSGQPGREEPQDPKLRPLLSPVIRKTATDDEVDAAAKKVEHYAAENAVARKQIGDIARRIIAAKKIQNYGTEKCQEYLTKWAKEFTETAPRIVPPKSAR